MGDELAGAADAIYQQWVQASPQFRKLREEGVLGFEDFAMLISTHVGALRQAMLFLAQQMEDPHPMDEAILDSLRACITGTATEPAG
jgi:hypothetical protein